jgi:hypothetical protein
MDRHEGVGDLDDWWVEAPDIVVYVADPPEPTATLLGPDGRPIAYVVDRRTVPIGFQRPIDAK